MAWNPTTVIRFTKGFPSSACTALVETDAGPGYLKGMGGPEGEHTLACEWVGTQLARWFGLTTFDTALIELTDADDVPFVNQKGERIGKARPGMAFISRAESGEPWSGDKSQLNRLINPQDIGRLVVFDTWTLNCDRHSWPEGEELGKARINRNNVFLSEEAPAGQFVLKAMDHTHCFTCGRALTTKLAVIDKIRDARMFGLFPKFRPFLDRLQVEQAVADLRRIDRSVLRRMTQTIPNDWDVAKSVQDALENLILERAGYVADNILGKLWPHQDLGFGEPDDERGTT